MVLSYRCGKIHYCAIFHLSISFTVFSFDTAASPSVSKLCMFKLLCGGRIIKGLLTTEEQVPISHCGPVMLLSGTILTQYSGTAIFQIRLGVECCPLHTCTHVHTCAHMCTRGSHIKMFGHLLLNQLPIFHICHGPHHRFFSPLTRQSLLPIFGAAADFCIVLPFPWILSFHQCLAFLLNWTRSIYGQTKIQSLCALEGDVCALWWPSSAHKSYLQLIHCYHSHSHDHTVLLAL